MKDFDEMTDEELRQLLSQPLSEEEEEEFRAMEKADRWLLILNLQEMDKRESDPNYNPADDPTCVLISTESDEE